MLRAKSHHLHQLQHPLLSFHMVADVMDDKRLPDDIAHRLARVKRRVRVLEDDLDLPPKRPKLLSIVVENIFTLKQYLALGGLFQPGDHTAKRCLAASALAHQAQCLSPENGQIHPVHRFHRVHGAFEYSAGDRKVFF